MRDTNHYAIRDVARLTGLPESTLRYYESIGLIQPVERNKSSKQRIYTQADVDKIDVLACLGTIGFSIDDIRAYISNISRVKAGLEDEITLLRHLASRLEIESTRLALQQKYVALKIRYWEAVDTGNDVVVKRIGVEAQALARELKHPK